MLEQIRSLFQDDQNVQNGASLLKTAERGVDQIISNLRTMKEKAIDAANDSNTDDDRRTIQKELDQRREIINDIAIGTQYNGKILLNGNFKRTYAIRPYEDPPGSGEMDNRPKVDVVFVVDTTGSMKNYINKVASNLKIFADSLTDKDLNWQFGLIRYDDITSAHEEDIGFERVSFSSGEFTKDQEEFTDALRELVDTLGNGGDAPESGYEGVMEAVSTEFRSESVKRIIVLSDAPVKKLERGDGTYSSSNVLDVLRKNEIKLSIITAVSSRYKAQINEDWKFLSDATKGRFYNIAGDYGSQLESEATDLKKDADTSIFFSKEIIGFPLWIHHGTQSGQHINVYIEDMRSKALGIDAAEVVTKEKANDAISIIESAIETALNEATNLGAYLQRLEYTGSNISTMRDNVQASESTIRDADMAKEMTEYMKYNLLSQSAQSMLAQANQNASSVLGFLQQ